MSGLLRSEMRKVFTTRLWWGLLVGILATSIALAVLVALLSGVTAAGRSSLGDPAAARGVYTAGTQTAYLFALAFGIITMTGEYRHQTITATVLASPRRQRVVTAKLITVFVLGAGYGVVAVLGGLIGGIPVILLRHGALFLTSAGMPRTLALTALAIALWAVLGLGVGTLIRNQVLALLVAIGVAWIAEPIVALGLNAAHLGAVAQFLPSQATSAVTSPATAATRSGTLSVTLLPWWAGALVLVGYTAVSGGLGAAITLRRDVT